MKAIILAAGRGSRLKETTNHKPKCMVKFKDKTLLEWQIDSLKKSCINEIAVVAGYKKEKIINKNISFFFENKLWNETNMVYTLFRADDWLSSDECIVSYSDIFYDPKIVHNLKESNEEISITYDINFKQLWEKRFSNPLDDLESFKINSMGYLTEIGRRVKNIKSVEGQFMGLLKITPSGWNNIKKTLSDVDIKKIDCTKMLQILIENKIKIKGIQVVEQWGEIDSNEDLKLYEEMY